MSSCQFHPEISQSAKFPPPLVDPHTTQHMRAQYVQYTGTFGRRTNQFRFVRFTHKIHLMVKRHCPLVQLVDPHATHDTCVHSTVHSRTSGPFGRRTNQFPFVRFTHEIHLLVKLHRPLVQLVKPIRHIRHVRTTAPPPPVNTPSPPQPPRND